MIDKLEKNGHKKFYYRFRTALVFLLLGIAIAAVATIPVLVSYRISVMAEDNSLSQATGGSSSDSGDSPVSPTSSAE